MKIQEWIASQGNSTKHVKKSDYLSFSNYTKKLKRRGHSQIHSTRPQLSWYQNQTRTLPQRKKKLQANIFDEYNSEMQKSSIKY